MRAAPTASCVHPRGNYQAGHTRGGQHWPDIPVNHWPDITVKHWPDITVDQWPDIPVNHWPDVTVKHCTGQT